MTKKDSIVRGMIAKKIKSPKKRNKSLGQMENLLIVNSSELFIFQTESSESECWVGWIVSFYACFRDKAIDTLSKYYCNLDLFSWRTRSSKSFNFWRTFEKRFFFLLPSDSELLSWLFELWSIDWGADF